MATVQEQFDAFMKSRKSKRPHVGMLVEGFDRQPNQVTFMHNGGKITIPIGKVLSPTKEKLSKKDFIDFNSKSVLLFISGSVFQNLTTFPGSTPICTPVLTCRKSVRYGVTMVENVFETLYLY
jgi:hypothetical protein